jgi:hypothetical protein
MPNIECNLTFSLALRRFVKFHGDCSSCSNAVRADAVLFAMKSLSGSELRL